ncbi:Cobalt-precorrin-5A hydrolase [Methanimicrococcus hongohii]|uniref:Cobalt-precorrin-5A hydrolase n=1 Tax=Methanimicrococcus hongohii TaxID=3028295 RepID=A0AA96ZTF5_9EURY|nr:cobalamin biosynthesis protein [Methanimicrococcus sp. Hf6]WNY23166.1 Cobalt-precorrin-5A hydrolase [Methanimicrococcus sp. Hf6]
MIIGIGARRGVTEQEVLDAVSAVLSDLNLSMSDIDCFASSVLKADEAGLLSAVQTLGKEIRFLDDDVLNETDPESESEAGRFGLKGVAEPAALALSNHKKLILKKQVYGRVTIAIAE